MTKEAGDLLCWKKGCDGKLVFIDGGACFQRWKCDNKKCDRLYTLNHGLVAHLKKRAQKTTP